MGIVCEKSRTMIQFKIQYEYFTDMGVNLRTLQSIQKQLDESSGDYKSTVAWKLHSDSSVMKRIAEFLVEIYAMIDNDPNKSIRFIASDVAVSNFLIRQVVHEDIQYFLYKIRKGQFLSQAMMDKRKDLSAKLL